MLKTTNRVLLVDGHEQMRELVRAFVEREVGLCICGEAVDGRDAIAKAQRLKPDLIILELPDAVGIEVAPELKKLLPQTPIVLFTQYESLLQGFEPREIGVDSVVPKDRGVQALRESIRNLLGESG